MTLNDREKFILHAMSIMVVDSMIKKFHNNTLNFEDVEPLTADDLINNMIKIRDGRCRNLSRVDVSELYDEICEEMLLGTEVHKDNI
jgi:hypothetical protein